MKIYAYCLMTNHVHLLLFDLKNNISKFMNKTNSRYAMYYNNKNGRTGVIFNDRYKSEAIENKMCRKYEKNKEPRPFYF